jgi:hypothetical protein
VRRPRKPIQRSTVHRRDKTRLQMGDVEMAGEVSVQLPTDPLQKNTFFMTQLAPPLSSPPKEADLYSKLKKLERNLEFLTLQEVLSSHQFCEINPSRNTSKTNSAVYEENWSKLKKKSNGSNLYPSSLAISSNPSTTNTASSNLPQDSNTSFQFSPH